MGVARITFQDGTDGSTLGIVDNPKYAYVQYNVADHEHVMGTITGPAVQKVYDALEAGGSVLAIVSIHGHERARCWLTTPHWGASAPGEMHFDERGLGSQLEGELIDSMDLVNVPLVQALAALEAEQGAFSALVVQNDIKFSLQLAGDADFLMSDAYDTLSIWRALELISRQLGGAGNPDAGQFFYDSGTMVLTVGKVGSSGDAVVFNANPVEGEAGGPTDVPVDIEVVQEPSLAGLASQVSILGGSSDHGLPSGTRFTGVTAVAGTAWPGTFVASVYAGTTAGGVYYLTDDLIFHPLSQPMGASSLYHDVTRGILYVTTDRGVYEHYASEGPGLWKQTGGPTSSTGPGNHPTFSGKCEQVSVDGLQVYALSRGNNVGINGLLTYPAIGGNVVQGAGYDYWTLVTSGDLLSGTAVSNAVDTYVYVVDANDPTKIIVKSGVFGGQGTKNTALKVPYAVARLVRVNYGGGRMSSQPSGAQPPQIQGSLGPLAAASGGIFVLTTGGTEGFYFIDGNRPYQLLDAAEGLPPLSINNVQFAGNGGPALVASTSAGLYVSGGAEGGNFNGHIEDVVWEAVSLYGGLQGLNVEFGANGAAGGLGPNQRAAANSGSFYQSCSAGAFWTDVGGANVDVVPALLGSTLGSVSGGWRLYRAGQQQNYVGRLVQQQPPFAPGMPATPVELAEIVADANTSPQAASQLLVTAGERYLSYISKALFQVTCNSFYRDDRSPLAALRPTDSAKISLERPVCPGDPGQSLHKTLYVRSHSLEVDATKSGDTVWTQTVLANSLVPQKLSIEELNADILYKQSRVERKGGKRR